MKQKLFLTLLAAILLAFATGGDRTSAALVANDEMSTFATGNNNLHPPDVMPPQ